MKCITRVKKSGFGDISTKGTIKAAKTELAKAHFSIVWYAFEEAPSVELKKI